MGVIENWHSSLDNIREVDWVKQQVNEELKALTTNVKDNFYKKEGDTDVVTYDMDVVKNYLSNLSDQVKDQDTKTAWETLKSKNAAAWIMAVQIALESMWYEVDKIDWILWDNTKRAVAEFQSKNWLNPDSYPWKDTIIKLCDGLDGKWWVVFGNWTENPDGNSDGNGGRTEIGVRNPGEVVVDEVVDEIEGDDWDKGKWKEKFSKGTNDVDENVDKVETVNGLKLNEDNSRYIYRYSGEVADGKPNWKWSVEIEERLTGKKGNKFEWRWENWRIVECTSYGNTIKIKYNTEWDAVFEASSWKTLKVENKNIQHVGRTASIINYIFKVVEDSWKEFKRFYYDDNGLRQGLFVEYNGAGRKKVLADPTIQMNVNNGKDLADWLNDYSLDTKGVKVWNIWKFGEDWSFKMNEWAEKEEDGRKYIEVDWKKYYEYQDGMNGLWYQSEDNAFAMWEFKDGKMEWKWTCTWANWDRYEWAWKEGKREWEWICTWATWNKYEWTWKGGKCEWKWTFTWINWNEYKWEFNDNKKEWEWIFTWADWNRYKWEFKDDKQEWQWIMTRVNGNKFEGEYKNGSREKWKFTLVFPKEIVWEYEVEMDDKWLKIVSEWNNKGKYLDTKEWRIRK